MMFRVGDCCSMPMQTLIADLIESQGGTTFLIQALNMLGVCSSQDTLQRFIQSKVGTKKGKHSCSGYFNSSSFTVILVDNIDFLHSSARVFKGTQNSSWHGTTCSAASTATIINGSSTKTGFYEQYTPLHQSSSRKRTERSSPLYTISTKAHTTAGS